MHVFNFEFMGKKSIFMRNKCFVMDDNFALSYLTYPSLLKPMRVFPSPKGGAASFFFFLAFPLFYIIFVGDI